ncbi:MAG: flippase-like domain-containing protein [Prevotellaceae bacterium]|jgi:uncharacterized protein (TIRG00374 family)|nr:flippase-like domain-containing protein [Prevotellaceae bacterium]
MSPDIKARSAPAPSVKPYQILIPIVLGLAVIVWLFSSEFDIADLSSASFTPLSVVFILIAFALMFLRDATMMCRFRLLSDKRISWKQAFVVNVLSEFTSTVTPTAIGGSSLVVFFLAKEGVEAGRSTTIMLVNLFLDELFFVALCPLLFLLLPLQALFPPAAGIATFGYVFIGLYALHLVWAAALFVGIFIRPDWVKNMLALLFRLPFIRRWRDKADVITDNLVQASRDIKHRSPLFWLKAFLLTFVTWSVRFLVVNAIFLAFVPVANHLALYARQVILWVFMGAMPTPGGSGMSELAFTQYYGDICSSGSIVLLVTLIWRLVSYYLYLFLGIFIIPRWLHEAVGKLGKPKA